MTFKERSLKAQIPWLQEFSAHSLNIKILSSNHMLAQTLLLKESYSLQLPRELATFLLKWVLKADGSSSLAMILLDTNIMKWSTRVFSHKINIAMQRECTDLKQMILYTTEINLSRWIKILWNCLYRWKSMHSTMRQQVLKSLMIINIRISHFWHQFCDRSLIFEIQVKGLQE